MPSLGNDVVDLTEAGASGKSGELGFVRRVFTPAERDWIRAAPDPDRALWRLWAAKEAAYKSARKSDPALVFAHSCFEVHPAEARVVLGERTFAVRWQEGPGWVHCLAVAGEDDGLERCGWAVGELAESGDASAQVRGLAARLLDPAGGAGVEIVRAPATGTARQGPPRVWVRGAPREDLEVSLSHDGRWIAAAVMTTG